MLLRLNSDRITPISRPTLVFSLKRKGMWNQNFELLVYGTLSPREGFSKYFACHQLHTVCLSHLDSCWLQRCGSYCLISLLRADDKDEKQDKLDKFDQPEALHSGKCKFMDKPEEDRPFSVLSVELLKNSNELTRKWAVSPVFLHKVSSS